MNKKQKLVNKKHRRNKERLKELKKASISLSSKKVEKLVSNSAVKKPAVKKPAVKKPAAKNLRLKNLRLKNLRLKNLRLKNLRLKNKINNYNV